MKEMKKDLKVSENLEITWNLWHAVSNYEIYINYKFSNLLTIMNFLNAIIYHLYTYPSWTFSLKFDDIEYDWQAVPVHSLLSVPGASYLYISCVQVSIV